MDKLTEVMQIDFEEFHNSRKIERAKSFASATGMHVNHNEYPSYFFGNPDAKFVLVHLNPKQKDNYSDKYEEEFKHKSFNEYLCFHRNYGKFKYGELATKKSKSRFDSKQVNFIKPFNVIDLNDNDAFVNLEKVIDDKLQLELIPFGSDSFKTNLMQLSTLVPYTDLLLDTITQQKRDYVIFCGKVFDILLKDYVLNRKDYSFKLQKKDGTTAKNNVNFSKIVLTYKGKKINAGIAQSFAQQGLTGAIMKEYGRKCYELYN
ncbi:hypothetical protein [Psychrobacter sp. GP33]|uniref:hypothetical protein n=1 Tax=Psychrobacter sp. GP33 TaxID=2758709 RepID=UPI0015F98427|nr:hypothetical protein [Psychrobacter sp. GP33]